MRITIRYVLSGSVLGVWDIVERQLRGGEDGTGQFIKMQITRLKTSDGHKAIGILVPKECAEDLSYELTEGAERVEEQDVQNTKKEQIEVKLDENIDIKIEENLSA